jgi:dCTP deaminase
VTHTKRSRRTTERSIFSEDDRLLLSCIAELFYRCRQVERYIEPIANQPMYAAPAKTIRDLIEEGRRDTQNGIRQSASVRLRSETRTDLLFDALRLIAKRFSRAHERLSVFPSVGVRPEAPEMLRRVLRPKPVPTILLTSLFNALEFNFAPEFLERRESVLQLAMCDFASPAAWAILAHEVGHALDHGEVRDIAYAIVDRLRKPKAKEVVRDLAEEIFADLVAAKLLGLAPILAAIAMERCVFDERLGYWSARGRKEKIHRIHPLMTWRLRVLHEAAVDVETKRELGEELAASETAKRFRLRLDMPDGAQRQLLEDRDEQHFERWIVPLVEQLRPLVDRLNLPNQPIDADSVKRVVSRLASNHPINAQGRPKAALRNLLSEYGRRAHTYPREFYMMANEFREDPMPIPALLLATHFRRRQILDEFLREPAHVAEQDASEEFCENMSRLDALAETSIRMLTVHGELLETLPPEDAHLDDLPQIAFPRSASRYTRVGREANLLSDLQILSRLVAEDEYLLFVTPIVDPLSQVGPSSLDVRLGSIARIMRVVGKTHLDLNSGEDIRQHFEEYRISADGLVLHPGQFALATTLEYFRFPADLAGRLEGRSTLARLGLQVHSTAGFVDPGYAGTLTFELANAGNLPIRIPPGFRLGQICFFPVRGVQVPYGNKLHRKYDDSLTVGVPMLSREPESRRRKVASSRVTVSYYRNLREE